jgi:hypothetical protein
VVVDLVIFIMIPDLLSSLFDFVKNHLAHFHRGQRFFEGPIKQILPFLLFLFDSSIDNLLNRLIFIKTMYLRYVVPPLSKYVLA